MGLNSEFLNYVVKTPENGVFYERRALQVLCFLSKENFKTIGCQKTPKKTLFLVTRMQIVKISVNGQNHNDTSVGF